MSRKVQLYNIKDECVVNAAEATPRRYSIFGVSWAYATNLQGPGAPMPKSDFNKDA